MLGHSVVLIEKDLFPRPHVGESLQGGILPMLAVLDVREAIESARFFRPKSSLIRWKAQTELRESPGEPGFQVDRGRFDQILLQSALASGVRVLQPAQVLETNPTVSVLCANGTQTTVDSRFIVNASGRSSALAAGKKCPTGKPTFALFAYFRDVDWTGPETRVEAGPSGWFWGAPIPGGLFNATVFVDKEVLEGKKRVQDLYLRLLASSQLLEGCLRGKMEGPVKVCDAGCSSCKEFFQGNMLRCGDAAFTIDPLSSQGVQTAIGSALHAAVVIHTILRRPTDEVLARRFYVDRLRKSVRFHRYAASRFYSDAAPLHRGAFWTTRSGQDSELKPIRMTSDTRIHVHPEARVEPVPVSSGEFITTTLGVTTPHLQEGLVFIDGISVAHLVEMICTEMSVAELARLWSCVVRPQNVFRFIQTLLAERVLLPSPDSADEQTSR
jgi:flavin-dependent dehydrogenase